MTTLGLNHPESCILHLHTSITSTAHQIQKSKQLLLGLSNPHPSTHSHQSIRIKKQDSNSLHLNINMEMPRLPKSEDKPYTKPVIQEIVVNGQKYVREKLFGRMVESKNVDDYNPKIRIEEENQCEQSFVQKLNLLEESSIKRQKQSSLKREQRIVEQKTVPSSETKEKTPLNFTTAFPNRIKRVLTENEEDYAYLSKDKRFGSNLPQASEHQRIQINETSPKRKRSKDRTPIFQKKVHRSEQKHFSESKFKNIQQKLKENEEILKEERGQFIRWPKDKQLNSIAQKIQKSKQSERVHKEMSDLRNHYNLPKPSRHNESANNVRARLRTGAKVKSKSKDSSSTTSPGKLNSLKFFSNGIYFTRQCQPIRCNKIDRQFQKLKRERYMADALKIPGVERYFTYSEIYQLYIKFKELGVPEYKWSQFLSEKVRRIAKFIVTQQRFTSA